MSEPERPIERLLHAAARERRRQAGDSFQLHPANRRLLQGEVVRVYGTSSKVPVQRRSWFQLWPRMAWSLGTFLVLGMAAWVTWQSHHATRYTTESFTDRSATNNQPSKDKLVASVLPAPAAPEVEAETPATTSGEALASAKSLADSRPALGGSPQSHPAPTRAASRNVELAGDKQKIAEKSAASTDQAGIRDYALSPSASRTQPGAIRTRAEESPPAASAPSTASFRRADSPASFSPTRGLAAPEPNRTAEAFLYNNAANTALTNALVSFSVQQEGTDLRVVDADGSVYTGRVIVPEAQVAPTTVTSQTNKTVAIGGGPNRIALEQARNQGQFLSQNGLNFRVAGTNRSLNQQVIFTGNFVPADETANAQMSSNVTALQNNRLGNQGLPTRQQQLQEQLPWNKGRISGQAVLDNRQTIAVEATPAPK